VIVETIFCTFERSEGQLTLRHGHDCRVGDNVILVNSAAAAGHVEIGDRALISGLVGIHQFTRIGKLAMISGGGKGCAWGCIE